MENNKKENRIVSFIHKHKVITSIIVTATITISASISISANVVANIKVKYEADATKKISEILRKENNISDTQIKEIVEKLNITQTTKSEIINTINNDKKKMDFTTIKYTFTDQDKTKITDYMLSYITYYQRLQEDNDRRLNSIYNDKSWNITKDYEKDNTESLIRYFEGKREEYKNEIQRMQNVLFEFYNISLTK
jgi:hypothetical protein